MKNPFAHVVSAYQGRHDSELVRPLADFYWRTLVVIAVLVSVGSIAYGTLKYFDAEKILEQNSPAETTAAPQSTFSDKPLNDLLDNFTKRQSQYELHKVTPPALVDPSK